MGPLILWFFSKDGCASLEHIIQLNSMKTTNGNGVSPFAVVAVSASGEILDPFVVVGGLVKVPKEVDEIAKGRKWEAFVTPKGSVDKAIITTFLTGPIGSYFAKKRSQPGREGEHCLIVCDGREGCWDRFVPKLQSNVSVNREKKGLVESRRMCVHACGCSERNRWGKTTPCVRREAGFFFCIR